MSSGRLPARLEVASLVRRAQSAGDFATVIRSGDPESGTLLLVITSRGRHFAFLERVLAASGDYQWRTAGPGESAETAEVPDFLAKRARSDPDLWAIELDIADPERFIAETIGLP